MVVESGWRSVVVLAMLVGDMFGPEVVDDRPGETVRSVVVGHGTVIDGEIKGEAVGATEGDGGLRSGR